MNARKQYLMIATICFVICVLIVVALSEHQMIRGFVGDVIVTILIYSIVKIFITVKPLMLGVFVLLFSYMVEGLQYIHIVDKIGLGENKIARIIIGTTFSTSDLIAYLIGVVIILWVDMKIIEAKKEHRLNSMDYGNRG